MEHEASPPGGTSGDRAERIRAALQTRFAPVRLEVQDDSAKHAGHMGARPGGQTHFAVLITAEAFAGLSRVARHRGVHDALALEFASGLHALSVVARTPDET